MLWGGDLNQSLYALRGYNWMPVLPHNGLHADIVCYRGVSDAHNMVGVMLETGVTTLMGWSQCYWRNYWVYNANIIAWIGSPLCDLCCDWHLGEGRFAPDASVVGAENWRRGPYEPCARTRAFFMLQRVFFRSLSSEICDAISCFLYDWHEP